MRTIAVFDRLGNQELVGDRTGPQHFVTLFRPELMVSSPTNVTLRNVDDWTETEESLLIHMRHQGMLFNEIALALNRREYDVACKYLKLVPLSKTIARSNYKKRFKTTTMSLPKSLTVHLAFKFSACSGCQRRSIKTTHAHFMRVGNRRGMAVAHSAPSSNKLEGRWTIFVRGGRIWHSWLPPMCRTRTRSR